MQSVAATVILAEGAIDIHAARVIEGAIEALITSEQVKIVLDWEKAEGINPLAIGALLSAQSALLHKSGELKFCRMTPAIRRVFFKFGVDPLFENYATLEDAVASFDEEWASGNECRAM